MKRRKLLSLLTALGILAAGTAALLLLTSFRAQAAVVEKPVEVRTVRTSILVPGKQAVTIPADGFLEPARSLEISSPVPGLVTGSHGDLKGGVSVRKGEALLVLDDRRARLGFENAKAGMISAAGRFTTAAGLDAVSREEWSVFIDRLGGAAPDGLPEIPDLDGRESLLAATMGVSAAWNGLVSASLDFQDHRIIAPFGGSLSGDGVAVGSRISPGVPLATLYETESLELQLSLPVSRIGGIEAGSEITVLSEGGESIMAEVLRVEPSLDAGNQMITIHAGLQVPESSVWLPGSYVRTSIRGPEYESVCRVPRKILIDGRLPVIDAGTLALLAIDILAYDSEDVIFTTGSDSPLEVIETVLQNPVEGLPLRRDTGS